MSRPVASGRFHATVAFRIDEILREAMLHVQEREGLSASEQGRLALVHWLTHDKGVLEPGAVAVQTSTPRRPGRPRRIHRGHVVTYRTEEGMATGFVSDDRRPDHLAVIQLDPPSKDIKHLHPSALQRRYFTAGQLASWMTAMPPGIVGEEMARAMRCIRRYPGWDEQKRLNHIASLWVGRNWRRIGYKPGMPPIYGNQETRRIASGAVPPRRKPHA